MASSLASDRSVADSQGDFVTRLATADDIQMVADLSKRSIGARYDTDYVVGRFEQYVNNKNVYCFLGLKDGKPVLFFIFYVVDGGSRILGLSGRVDPDVRKLGLLKIAGRLAITKYVLPAHAGALKVRATSTNAVLFKKNMKDQVVILAERAIFRCQLPGQIHPAPVDKDVVCVDSAQLRHIVTNNTLKQLMFPEGVIVNNTDVFEAIEENVADLEYFNETRYMSRDTYDPTRIHAISLGSKLDCDDGKRYRYNFNYYGKPDLTILKTHILAHLRRFCEAPKKQTIWFIVMLPLEFTRVYSDIRMHREIVQMLDDPVTRIETMQQVAVEYNVDAKDWYRDHSKL